MWVLQTVDVLKLEKFSVWRPSNFGTQVKVCNILNLLIWEFPPLWQILAGNSFHHLRFLNGRSCYLEKLLISEVSELWDKISSAFWTFEIGWTVTCWIINFLQQAYTFSSVYSPPARWGLLDFMSVACSSPPLLSSSSCSTATLDAQCSLSDLNHDHPRPVFPAGPQPRPSPPSVPCRTSTTTIHAQCSLPDLNREYPRQVFPAGPHVGRYGTKNVQKKVRKNVILLARIV